MKRFYCLLNSKRVLKEKGVKHLEKKDCTSPVHLTEVWKTPDVPKTDCIRHTRQEKLRGTVPGRTHFFTHDDDLQHTDPSARSEERSERLFLETSKSREKRRDWEYFQCVCVHVGDV